LPVPGKDGSQLVTRNSQLNYLGTFHSISARILRRHAERLGFTSSFTILDVDDQLRLIKTLLSERNIDPKQMPPKTFMAIIQGWKDRGYTPEKVPAEDRGQMHGKALEVYKSYQERLLAVNAMDFGDLLLHNLTLFSQFPDVLSEYSRRFRYILVDEYQDTNVAQYLWLRLMALTHKNNCCVGDDDQSIYGWRGAEVGNILRFEKDFPGATVIRLERNYRSTQHILSAASKLIANNQGRLGKTLWTESGEGEKVRVKSTWDGEEEAQFIGEEIEALQRAKEPLSSMAILVRAGFQTRAFEERFLTMGIPYKVVGGLRFYERAEIRDAIAYLRVIASPSDDLAFERIVNTPKRGIGNATLEHMHTEARAQHGSLTQAAQRLLDTGHFKGKLQAALGALLMAFERWRALSKELPLTELAERVLEDSGYRAMWQAEKTPEAQGRVENLKELVRAMGEFETLTAFLEHVSLITDMDASAAGDMVSIMTLHAAKGLEFHHVFLPGWEEGLFPHQRALDESGGAGLEEERRLAYVGITRARRLLTISFAANRRVYNQWQSSIPSRFIGELDAEHIERLEGGAYGASRAIVSDLRREMQDILKEFGTGRLGLAWEDGSRSGRSAAEPDAGQYRANPSGGWNPSRIAHRPQPGFSHAYRTNAPAASQDALAIDMRVFHQKFGYGRILRMDGNHLEIAFEKAGVKKVMKDYVKKA
jgi:DNA helicase-2/ATP-dependent DNA helicase PcrA